MLSSFDRLAHFLTLKEFGEIVLRINLVHEWIIYFYFSLFVVVHTWVRVNFERLNGVFPKFKHCYLQINVVFKDIDVHACRGYGRVPPQREHKSICSRLFDLFKHAFV